MSTSIDNLLTKSANIITIESEPKVGKLTFTAFLLASLLKKKALLFTPQDSYLFSRRLKVFVKQFSQLCKIEEDLNVFYLKTDWHHLKQKYGYAFFLSELENVIRNAEEEIIIFHRFGEFFEFQDRYEIEPIFRALIKLSEVLNKKIIFLTNTKNENFEFIKNITEEFADVIIDIRIDAQNSRKIFIKDILAHQHFPPYRFMSQKQKFTLEKYEDKVDEAADEKKRLLIANLSSDNERSLHLCKFLLNCPTQFTLSYADSFQSILHEIFIVPDVIVILMSHSDVNFNTIKVIKEHLKDTKIVVILDQEFIRSEDKRRAFSLGCDELFHSRYKVDDLVMALEKLTHFSFYQERLVKLSSFPQLLESKRQMLELLNVAEKNAVFFTLFKFKMLEKSNQETLSVGRAYDYLFKESDVLYCITINTCYGIVDKIIENYKRKEVSLSLLCHAEVLNKKELEACVQ